MKKTLFTEVSSDLAKNNDNSLNTKNHCENTPSQYADNQPIEASAETSAEVFSSSKEIPHTPYGYFHQLESLIKAWPNAERLSIYLEEIHKALEEKDGIRALALTDDLEEMIDLDLKSMSQ